MCSNPLPPAVRKPGTVGRPAARGGHHGGGRHAAAARRDGRDRHPRPQRHRRLREQPKANAEAFVNGWFRTGDQGVMDADGYVSITGRLKEIINRGGEKISPREVDEILMDHPRWRRWCASACRTPSSARKSPRWWCCAKGQRHRARAAGVRGAARRRLQGAKKILFMTEIPKGATGKLQRIGLAAKLGLG